MHDKLEHLRFATVGDNCIDRFMPVGQSLIGGNAVNVAVQLARLGHSSFYFGAVGNDRDGLRTRHALMTNNVRVDYVQERSGATAYTNIQVLESGDRVIVYEDFGVCAGYAPEHAEIDILMMMSHVHIGWLDDGGFLKKKLINAGISVSQDLSVNVDIGNLSARGLSVAFGSAGEDKAVAEAMIVEFLKSGAQLVVVTRGAYGSTVCDGALRFDTGIEPVEVIDTTGAGDSFIAGFLSARLAGCSLQDCLRSGRKLAAFTCGHHGGFPQAPEQL